MLEELRRLGAVLNLVGAFNAADGTLPIRVPPEVLFMVQLKINLPFLVRRGGRAAAPSCEFRCDGVPTSRPGCPPHPKGLLA